MGGAEASKIEKWLADNDISHLSEQLSSKGVTSLEGILQMNPNSIEDMGLSPNDFGSFILAKITLHKTTNSETDAVAGKKDAAAKAGAASAAEAAAVAEAAAAAADPTVQDLIGKFNAVAKANPDNDEIQRLMRQIGDVFETW